MIRALIRMFTIVGIAISILVLLLVNVHFYADNPLIRPSSGSFSDTITTQNSSPDVLAIKDMVNTFCGYITTEDDTAAYAMTTSTFRAAHSFDTWKKDTLVPGLAAYDGHVCYPERWQANGNEVIITVYFNLLRGVERQYTVVKEGKTWMINSTE